MFRKKDTITICTPLVSWVRREVALAILQSHPEVITLNPLVTGFKAITAPRDAPTDEYYSTWYEITEKIQYIPGIGRMGEGEIKFNGCFHNMEWGLQTHIYAPMNVDLRNKYRIAGNQVGEIPEPLEIGLAQLGAPREGLYLREDIQIKCNVAFMSFVKSQLKIATKEMVARIMRKAELLERGELIATADADGRLKIINPADRSSHIPPDLSPPVSPLNPAFLHRSSSQMQPHPYHPSPSPGIPFTNTRPHHASLPPGFRPPPWGVLAAQADQPPAEMPGSFYFHPPNSPMYTGSDVSNRDSYLSRYSQQTYSTDGYRSPGLEQTGFVNELPADNETRKEGHKNDKNADITGDRRTLKVPLLNPVDSAPRGENKYRREQRQQAGRNR